MTVPPKTPFVKSVRHAAFGDPYQFHAEVAPCGTLCEGVSNVLVGVTRTLVFRLPRKKEAAPASCMPVILVPSEAEVGASSPVVAAANVGRGRMLFCTDTQMFQPFRIEHDDNANLLVNTVGWLTGRPVDSAIRAKFRAILFLSEKDFGVIAQEDAR